MIEKIAGLHASHCISFNLNFRSSNHQGAHIYYLNHKNITAETHFNASMGPPVRSILDL